MICGNFKKISEISIIDFLVLRRVMELSISLKNFYDFQT